MTNRTLTNLKTGEMSSNVEKTDASLTIVSLIWRVLVEGRSEVSVHPGWAVRGAYFFKTIADYPATHISDE